MALGKTIQAIREAKGLSQGSLAKLTGWSEDHPKRGVSQGAISALEKRDSKSSKHAPALAKALNVSIDTLIMGTSAIARAKQDIAEYNIKDPILDDLATLAPEDADVWRAQIRAAAIKVRRLNEERDREQATKAHDPPIDSRRTA